MASVPSPRFTEILYSAMAAKHGLFLRSPEIVRLKAVLYATRKLLADPELDILTIRTAPNDPSREIWIIKAGPTP